MQINSVFAKLKFYWTDPSKTLWVQPTFGAVFAIVFSLIASASHRILPRDWVVNIEPQILSGLIEIVASSMLAVTTFSLSIMVSALSSVASGATPNARVLIMADGSTRIAISSFISAFIYAVIAKIALGLQYYGSQGRFVMFIGTILVLFYLVVTLIRWVQTLSTLGSMGDTLAKVETYATDGLANFRANPTLGMASQKPQGVANIQVKSMQTGYIGTVLAKALNDWADEHRCHIHIAHNVGDFVSHDDVLFEIFIVDNKQNNDEQSNHKHESFTDDDLPKTLGQYVKIVPQRNMYQDHRYGMSVLGEIGHRTLSVGVNDPSTADRVLTLMTRLLIDTKPSDDKMDSYERVSILPLTADMFIKPLFVPLARDGIGSFEFMKHMLVCLAKIYHNAPERQMQQAAFDDAKTIYQMIYAHYDQLDRDIIDGVWREHFGVDVH